MTPTLIDADGLSTIAAADAQAALAAGDMPCAREKYVEAGRRLEGDASRAQTEEDKHLALFLAATHYYKGGHYQKALDLGRWVHAGLLPLPMQPLLRKFLRDAQDRASPDYEMRIAAQAFDFWQQKDHVAILELLQEHPYIVPSGGLAFLRAVCCESLGNYRAAAIFYADAVRMTPQDPGLVFTAAAVPLTLAQQGKLQEAWEYSNYQLERMPDASTYTTASLVCFHRAQAEKGEAAKALLEQQGALFEQARVAYAALPPLQQNVQEIRALMVLGFEAATVGLLRMGNLDRGRAMCDAAMEFQPDEATPGIIPVPDVQSVEDRFKADQERFLATVSSQRQQALRDLQQAA